MTRPLTEITNDITGVSINSNRIELPAGTYRVSGHATAYDSNRHRCGLYNTDDSSFSVLGSVSDARGSSIQTDSFIVGKFTLAATKHVELQHYSTDTKNTTGLGQPLSEGNEIYANLEIWKIN